MRKQFNLKEIFESLWKFYEYILQFIISFCLLNAKFGRRVAVLLIKIYANDYFIMPLEFKL